jgi:hypothetical protein
MKNILSLAFAFVALFSVTKLVAQNRHYVNGPTAQCDIAQNSVTITGKIAGCGEGPLYARLDGEFDCVNGGGNVPDSDNWSDFTKVLPVGQKKSGGNINISVTLESLCPKSTKNENWTFASRNLQITLYRTEADANADVNRLLGPTAVSPNCF